MNFDHLSKQGFIYKRQNQAAIWFLELPSAASERAEIAMLCGAAIEPPGKIRLKHHDVLLKACRVGKPYFHDPESFQMGVLREALNIVERVMKRGIH